MHNMAHQTIMCAMMIHASDFTRQKCFAPIASGNFHYFAGVFNCSFGKLKIRAA
jgi:hypothetical protein